MSLKKYNELRRRATAAGVFEKGDTIEDLERKLGKKRKRRRSSKSSRGSSSSIFSGSKWVIR